LIRKLRRCASEDPREEIRSELAETILPSCAAFECIANVETAIAVQHGNQLQFQLFSLFVLYQINTAVLRFLPCLGNIIGMWRALYGNIKCAFCRNRSFLKMFI
jgi:hypothetical protein